MPDFIRNWDDAVRPLREHGPGVRRTSVRAIGRRAQPGQAIYTSEHAEVMMPDDGVQVIDYVEGAICVNGHVLREGVAAAAQCGICGQVCCTTPGCSYTCIYCGSAVCRLHCRVVPEGAYCRGCWSRRLVRNVGRVLLWGGRRLFLHDRAEGREASHR